MILVAIGGFFGAAARFWITQMLNKQRFPFGTLLINASGAFLLGVLVGNDVEESWRLLIGTGFLGAFTTFSTWLFEAAEMKPAKAACYIAVTCTAGFLGAWFVL